MSFQKEKLNEFFRKAIEKKNKELRELVKRTK